MAQVVNPGVVQGMDPAQLWQAQQALNLQRQSLMQNLVQNQINQSQVRNQKKAQEFTAYDKVAQGLVDASNGDLILAMGINPGLFKYGFMKFSGMNADQAEIAVENIRKAGIQNPDVIQKLRFKDILLDPNLPDYIVPKKEEDSGTGKQNVDYTPPQTTPAAPRTATTTYTPVKTEPAHGHVTPPAEGPKVEVTAGPLFDWYDKNATSKQRKYLGYGVTDTLLSGQWRPQEGTDPFITYNRESRKNFAEMRKTDPKRADALELAWLRGVEAYYWAQKGDPQAKKDWERYFGEQGISRNTYAADLRKIKANIEANFRMPQGAAPRNYTQEQVTEMMKKLSPVNDARGPRDVGESHGEPTFLPLDFNLKNDYGGGPGVPQSQAAPVTDNRLAQTNFASDAGNAPLSAAMQSAPQLGNYQGRAEDTEVPDPSTVPGNETVQPYGQVKETERLQLAQTLGTILGLGTNATPDIEAGLIAARNMPGVQAFEAVAQKDPEKAKGSPLAPRIAEALRVAGQKVRTSMELAAQSLRGEVPFNDPVRKAWRDSQLQIENTKADDFLGQYKIASDQMLDRMHKIYRNPKGAEESYQDFVAHALGGGEGYLNKKNLNLAVDQLIASINQNAAQLGLQEREMTLKEKYFKLEAAAAFLKGTESTVPPGMDPTLWKMVNDRVKVMMDNATDKNGKLNQNGFVEQVNLANNRQIWDMYNMGIYRLAGGNGSFSSKGYQAWAGPFGAANIVRGWLAKVFPGSRWAQTKFLQDYGDVEMFSPSVDVTQNEPGYDPKTDPDLKAREDALRREFGITIEEVNNLVK